jgi:hypothetical protein
MGLFDGHRRRGTKIRPKLDLFMMMMKAARIVIRLKVAALPWRIWVAVL